MPDDPRIRRDAVSVPDPVGPAIMSGAGGRRRSPLRIRRLRVPVLRAVRTACHGQIRRGRPAAAVRLPALSRSRPSTPRRQRRGRRRRPPVARASSGRCTDLLYETPGRARRRGPDHVCASARSRLARLRRRAAGHVHARHAIQRGLPGRCRSGVNGTPTFFINGERHDGPWDLDVLQGEVTNRAASGRTEPRAAALTFGSRRGRVVDSARAPARLSS